MAYYAIVSILQVTRATSYTAVPRNSDTAVSSRRQSRGENFAAVVFDVLAHGCPLITNGHGAMAELPSHCVLMLPDEFRDDDLVAALETLWDDTLLREQMGIGGARVGQAHLHPARVPRCIRDAIEAGATRAPGPGLCSTVWLNGRRRQCDGCRLTKLSNWALCYEKSAQLPTDRCC